MKWLSVKWYQPQPSLSYKTYVDVFSWPRSGKVYLTSWLSSTSRRAVNTMSRSRPWIDRIKAQLMNWMLRLNSYRCDIIIIIIIAITITNDSLYSAVCVSRYFNGAYIAASESSLFNPWLCSWYYVVSFCNMLIRSTWNHSIVNLLFIFVGKVCWSRTRQRLDKAAADADQQSGEYQELAREKTHRDRGILFARIFLSFLQSNSVQRHKFRVDINDDNASAIFEYIVNWSKCKKIRIIHLKIGSQ